jgi:GT2 family glycosyltransferase
MVKPSVSVVDRLSTPHGSRRCLVAVCSNERSVYRQTAASLMRLGWGQRVTDAAKAHGFDDIKFAWVSKFLLVSDLRNEAVRIAKQQGCTHVLFLDADMEWPADVLVKMLAHHDKGIVSGLYFLKTWPHWPVALTRPRVNATTQAVDYDYDKAAPFESSLVPEALVGMGCAIVPMSVFEAMPAPWFEYQQDGSGAWTVTEDVAFCQKAAALGCPIYLDPSIKCGHVGQQVVSEPWYQRSLIEIQMLDSQPKAKAV